VPETLYIYIYGIYEATQAHPEEAHPEATQAHPEEAHPEEAHPEEAHPEEAHPEDAEERWRRRRRGTVVQVQGRDLGRESSWG
jgi:hypothetical protein